MFTIHIMPSIVRLFSISAIAPQKTLVVVFQWHPLTMFTIKLSLHNLNNFNLILSIYMNWQQQ